MDIYDKTGRKMEDGDLFRVPHFTDRRRRRRWLYFFLKHKPELPTEWWGVDIRDGFDKHRWPVCESDGERIEVCDVLLVRHPKLVILDYYDRPINREILRTREESRDGTE